MRVLHLRASPFLGSPERLLASQVRRLDAARARYLFGVFDEQGGGRNAFVARLTELGQRVFRLPGSRSSMAAALRGVVAAARAGQADLLCSHDYKSDVIGWLAASWLGRPLVAVFHGRTSHDRKVRAYERLDDWLLRRSTLVVAVSHAGRRRLEARGVRRDRVVVIPNALDANVVSGPADGAIRRRLRLAPDAPLVVFSGRLSREKGLDVLLRAMARVVAVEPAVTVVLLGTGPEEARVREGIAQRGLGRHVRLLGFQHDVTPFLREMSFGVVPSRSEGMPLAILEAYAVGKPVVATNVGGVPEVVEHGRTGLLVEPEDPVALAAGMIELIRDGARAVRMGEAGARRLASDFTVEAQTERYLETFERALCERSTTTC